MPNSSKTFWRFYWVVVLLAFAATTTMLFVYTPVEKTMGPIQKIFYVHLPSAINAFLACLLAFIAGIGYLWQRRMRWDELSAASAKIATIMCSVVLLTGMIWGRYAWGKWWVWSPRLTFSLLLWLLYVVYLIVRSSIENPQRRAMICAVYAIAAFLDVPLVYLSVRLMPDIHPKSIQMVSSMRITLAVWFLPVTLLTIGMITALTKQNRLRRLRDEQRLAETAWSPDEPDVAAAE